MGCQYPKAPFRQWIAQAQTLNDTSGLAIQEPGLWRQGRRRSVLADSCLTNSGTTGTCLTRFKCMRQSGTVNGYCGTYGVCCESESKKVIQRVGALESGSINVLPNYRLLISSSLKEFNSTFR